MGGGLYRKNFPGSRGTMSRRSGILEQLDCTTVIEPGDTVRQDALGNLLITVG